MPFDRDLSDWLYILQDIHTYENLIPDEIKAFLHDQTQTKQFLESLNVTIEHVSFAANHLLVCVY